MTLANSRGPASLASVVAELGPRARALDPAEAAAAGDWVVAAIPMRNFRQLPADAMAGKVVLETMNHISAFDGHIEELSVPGTTTSQVVQEHLRETRLVKAFNNIASAHITELARPAGDARRSALPIASDHPDAIAAASTLLDTLGFDALDVGTLKDSWRFEPGTPAFVFPYTLDPSVLTTPDAYTPATPAGIASLRAAISAASDGSPARTP